AGEGARRLGDARLGRCAGRIARVAPGRAALARDPGVRREGRGRPSQGARRDRCRSRERRVTSDLVVRVVWLCRALRARGLLVTMDHGSDAVRALQAGAILSRDRAYLALRCIFTSRPEEFAIFDELFWRAFAADAPLASLSDGARASSRQKQQVQGSGQPTLARWLQQGEGAEAEDSQEVPGASDRSALVRKDFASFASVDLE